MKRLVIFIMLLTFLPNSLMAKEVGKETGLPIPRFVILKSNKSNIRKGPGMKYGIIWTYLRKGYPMEVIAEFENWRKLRDIDGTEGWINENLVTGRRNAIVIANKFSTKPNKYKSRLKAKEMVLFKHPDETSYPVVKAEFGVIASISKCGLEWCKIRVDKYSGWIRKENLWGVYKEEIIG